MARASKRTKVVGVARAGRRVPPATAAIGRSYVERAVNYIAMSRMGRGHEDITAIGGTFDGKTWTMPIAEAITDIRAARCFYYTVGFYSGEKRYLAVVEGKRPYLRARSDGKWNDNLLGQPCIDL